LLRGLVGVEVLGHRQAHCAAKDRQNGQAGRNLHAHALASSITFAAAADALAHSARHASEY
jgi:hypothetical protein